MTISPAYLEGVGRRKTAVARVRLYHLGSLAEGKQASESPFTFRVNGRPWNEYFPVIDDQTPVKEPFSVTNTWGAFDVSVQVRGGGVHAQADAVKLGLARALEKHRPDTRKPLRDADLLSRDPREKERKKPGLKRARRAPQWQKR